jgi:hypothetical protein
MTTISLRSVRYAFTMFLLALTLFAVAESAFGGRADRAGAVAAAEKAPDGCGTVEQPCVLETFTVVATADTPELPVQVAEADASAGCGTEAVPCRLPVLEVRAEAPAGLLASAERSVGMTLRVRS